MFFALIPLMGKSNLIGFAMLQIFLCVMQLVLKQKTQDAGRILSFLNRSSYSLILSFITSESGRVA